MLARTPLRPRFRALRQGLRCLVTAVALAAVALAQPAAAQGILRDAETEAMFQTMTSPLAQAAGLGPRAVRVVLVNDDSINAFVVGGQAIYIHSGLIQAADNANQVQGVIAHELGHIADGHVALADQGAKPAMGIYLLSMVLGLATMAAGGGEAGAGILAAGQQVALGKYLSFSRVQEATADASGARYLQTAGITGRGMIGFFKKLQQQEYRYAGEIDPYMQSHPLSGDRIANLTAELQAHAAWGKPSDPALEEQFRRVRAKLQGYVMPAARTLNDFPDTNQSTYAQYARAYAFHKGGFPDRAEAEAVALVARSPNDPYFQEVRGQILLEAGRPADAIKPLRAAVEGTRNNPLIATTLGHALIATEDKEHLAEAIRVLRTAVARDDQNPFAWYQLGTAYERTGDTARAALATAERASMTGDSRTAVASARYALANIPSNTSDWIRAQDIAMAAQNDLDDNKRRRR